MGKGEVARYDRVWIFKMQKEAKGEAWLEIGGAAGRKVKKSFCPRSDGMVRDEKGKPRPGAGSVPGTVAPGTGAGALSDGGSEPVQTFPGAMVRGTRSAGDLRHLARERSVL